MDTSASKTIGDILPLAALALLLASVVGVALIQAYVHPTLVACIADCIATEDLLAQQSMATSAWWMLVATLVATALSAGALFGLLLSLRQTRITISDTREIGEYQTQAYLHVMRVEASATSGLRIWVKNSGQTPASHFMVNATVQAVPRGAVKSQYAFPGDGFLLFSAISAQEELSVGISVPPTALTPSGLRELGGEVLLLTGTIIYTTVFNHDHETQFVFYGVPLRNGVQFARSPANLRTFNRLGPEGLLPSQYQPQTAVRDLTAVGKEAAPRPDGVATRA